MKMQAEDEDVPDAINVPFPRPAALFRLSSGSSDDSTGSDESPPAPPPRGRFVLPDVTLRKVARRPLFDNFDEAAYDIKPPTQMLRFIDALRYHRPTDEERAALNVSSATERLSLHVLHDILVVCGARKGFRFSSGDIVRLRGVADSLDAYYRAVDDAFRELPADVVRFRFTDATRLEDDAGNFARLCDHRKNGCIVANGKVDNVGSQDAVRRQAFQFQWLARQYVVAFARLRNAVLEIRLRLDETTKTPPVAPTLADLNDPVEAEFESKSHHPFPVYMLVLIQKYHREQRAPQDRAAGEWTPASADPPVDSIAHFALYLSGVVLQPAPLTIAELGSVQVLLQVIKAQFVVDAANLTLHVTSVELASGKALLRPGAVEAMSCTTRHRRGLSDSALTHKALTTLLFEFLATVRELRLVPRAKELLKKPQPQISPEKQQKQEQQQQGKQQQGKQEHRTANGS